MGSIPYDVPWTEENKHLLRDSIMQHCEEPGLLPGQLCCGAEEWTCRKFTPSRQKFHSAILSSLQTSRSSPPPLRPHPPLLIILAGVPGSGKTAILLPIAKALVRLRRAGRSNPSWGDVQRLLDPPASTDGKEGTHPHGSESHGRAIAMVSADDIKAVLARGRAGNSAADGEGAVVVSSDALSDRVRAATANATADLSLLHSQYLHRESIWVADRAFESALHAGCAILLEKTMTSWTQVEPYVAEGNQMRQGAGHKVSMQQLERQHSTYSNTLRDLQAQARQPEASAWLQVWVVNTSGVIDRLRAGDSVSDARCAAELQWSSTG